MRNFYRTLLESAGHDLPHFEKAAHGEPLAKSLLLGNPAATFYDAIQLLRPDVAIDARFGRDYLRIKVRRHEKAWVEYGGFDRTGNLGDEVTVTVRTPDADPETTTHPASDFDPVAAAREVAGALPAPSESTAAKYPAKEA